MGNPESPGLEKEDTEEERNVEKQHNSKKVAGERQVCNTSDVDTEFDSIIQEAVTLNKAAQFVTLKVEHVDSLVHHETDGCGHGSSS